MIIYSNSIVTLNYDPSTDILSVTLPDFSSFTIGEVERSFQIIVENVKNYDIKNLLLDSSRSVIDVEDTEYKRVVIDFSKELARTRLGKLARVESTIAAKELLAASVTADIQLAESNPVDFRNFTNEQEAMQWLRAAK